MNATTYTAAGVQTITNGVAGQSFQPDLIWTKTRSTSGNNLLIDSVRGAANYLISNTTGAEGTDSGYVTSFNSNGYSLGGSNYASGTIVGWQWKAGGTAVSNTNGSITSQVSANTTSGFSVVTYTAPSSGHSVFTFGHGLGVAPSLVISKSRSAATDWSVYHISTGNTQGLYLNQALNAQTSSAFWNNTSPTSSVVTIGTGQFGASETCVAYCWAPIAGYSAFGKYTGNGSADGPFVYTGFRPRFIVIKSTGVEDWRMFDTSRSTYNIQGATLYPNTSSAENAAQLIDINSNGFKCRTTDGAVNGSGTSYIYMAFAENPFKYANAR